MVLHETSFEAEGEPGLYRLAASAALAWPGTWTITSISAAPVIAAPWGGAPHTIAEYRRRVERMLQDVATAGITGSEWLRHPPSGWLPVLEISVKGLVALKTRPENHLASVGVGQIKEKFGRLRLYASAIGNRRLQAAVAQICAWAELCCENRCMMTGMPGTLRQGDWLLTLSDEARELQVSDPDTFAARLYPPCPDHR